MNRIIVSRTDSIGDVALTLPLCRWIRETFPHTTLVFLCKAYTEPVVACFQPVDSIITLEHLALLDVEARNNALNADMILHVFPNITIAKWAKIAGIPYRIGTSHRWFHFLYCNYRLSFSRKTSPLHEAILNFQLLKPMGLKSLPDWEEIKDVGLVFQPKGNYVFPFNHYLIIHPKSQGSAMEYPLDKYRELAVALVDAGYQVLITGTQKERELVEGCFDGIQGIHNVMGHFSLPEFISLIDQSEGVIACSTGPLHLAGSMNRKALGLFSPRKPIHPGRWKPLGLQSTPIVYDEACVRCQGGNVCNCIQNISVESIISHF